MDQRTSDWLEYRKGGLGSSDAPIIMGVSPYRKIKALYEEKVGIKEGFKGNWATERGNMLEPKARADYELRYDIEAPAALLVHAEHEWLRASLDGYNKDLGIVLEIKCPGAKDHAIAESGKVPDHYYPQLQHQLMVSGAAKAHYYSFKDEVGILVEVLPDHDYMKILFEKESQFWFKNVCARVCPSS